jgi:hypothetical protein
MKPIVARLILGYLALNALLLGFWAQFAPRSFFDDFPGFGRVWVSVDGPFNEHLVRDIGGLNLALAALLIAAAWLLRRELVIVATVASLLYGAPHLIYHIAHRNILGTGDSMASLGGLALFVVLPAWLLAENLRSREDREA